MCDVRESRGFFIKLARIVEDLATREIPTAEIVNRMYDSVPSCSLSHEGHNEWKEYAAGNLAKQKMQEDHLLGGHKPSKTDIFTDEDEMPKAPIMLVRKAFR